MLGFARGLKYIRSALLNVVELDPGTRQIGLLSGYIITHQLHALCRQHTTYDVDNKANQKIMKLAKIFRGKEQSDPPGKRGSVTLIHPVSYKPQFFIDVVLQCLVDKYQITYQIIWGEGVVRPHLMESSYYKTLGPLKGAPILHYFLHKKYF